MLNKKIVKKGNSKISGYGLFAKELICKGELIWKPTEDVITRIHISIFETLSKKEQKDWINHVIKLEIIIWILMTHD